MDRRLTDFCNSDYQLKVIKMFERMDNITHVANELGVHRSVVSKIVNKVRRRAADKGYDPENHRDYPVGANQIAKGYSDLIRYPKDDPLGRIIGWVKTNREIAQQMDECRMAVEAMKYELPQFDPVAYKGNSKNSDHFTVLPIGDPHIGLRVYEREARVNWDVEIALRVFTNVFTRLLERTPDTEEIIIFNSGDFWHADNIQEETARSKHKLDMDGRPGFWMRAGISIMMMIIDMCLVKYKKVHFINTPGNHDDLLGLMLGINMEYMYANEPRFSCQVGEDAYQYVERGDVALGFAHGHRCKLASLPGKMANDEYEMWGRTTHRHWFTGHVHHNQWIQFKEHPGCTVESVGIIPPKDAYAHGGGFGGGRGTQLCIFDKRGGYMPDRYAERVLKTD